MRQEPGAHSSASQPTAAAVSGAEGTERLVRDVMTPGVVAIPEDASAAQAARALVAHGVHAVLVVSDAGAPLGWATAETLRHSRGLEHAHASVGSVITEQVTGIEPDVELEVALYALSMSGVTRLVVRAKGSGFPIGVVTDMDLVDPS
jgi:CBS domain-containing protein